MLFALSGSDRQQTEALRVAIEGNWKNDVWCLEVENDLGSLGFGDAMADTTPLKNGKAIKKVLIQKIRMILG